MTVSFLPMPGASVLERAWGHSLVSPALKGQIYWDVGRDEFIEKHSAEDKELKEIPRAQLNQSSQGLSGSL
jgi:hypothetical protein